MASLIRPQNIKRKLFPYDKIQIVSPVSLPNSKIPMFSGVLPSVLDPIVEVAEFLRKPIGIYLTSEEMDLSGGIIGWLPELWVDEVISLIKRVNATVPVVIHLSGVKIFKKGDFDRTRHLLELSIRGGVTSFEVMVSAGMMNRWKIMFSDLYCCNDLGWHITTPGQSGQIPFVYYSSDIYDTLRSQLDFCYDNGHLTSKNDFNALILGSAEDRDARHRIINLRLSDEKKMILKEALRSFAQDVYKACE